MEHGASAQLQLQLQQFSSSRSGSVGARPGAIQSTHPCFHTQGRLTGGAGGALGYGERGLPQQEQWFWQTPESWPSAHTHTRASDTHKYVSGELQTWKACECERGAEEAVLPQPSLTTDPVDKVLRNTHTYTHARTQDLTIAGQTRSITLHCIVFLSFSCHLSPHHTFTAHTHN